MGDIDPLTLQQLRNGDGEKKEATDPHADLELGKYGSALYPKWYLAQGGDVQFKTLCHFLLCPMSRLVAPPDTRCVLEVHNSAIADNLQHCEKK